MSDAADHSYAVPYTPASVASRSIAPTFKTLVQERNVRYIRFQLADPTNQVRYRVLPAATFAKILESPRPSVTILQAIIGIAFLSLAEGFSPAEEYLFTPDLSTLRILPYKPGFASLTGYLQYKTPHPGLDGKLSFDVPADPRNVLKRVVECVYHQLIFLSCQIHTQWLTGTHA
jgi:glutamine synthetase